MLSVIILYETKNIAPSYEFCAPVLGLWTVASSKLQLYRVCKLFRFSTDPRTSEPAWWQHSA